MRVNFGDPRLPERFWSKCMPEPNSGCWLWFAKIDRDGYGQFRVGPSMRRVYRIAYEALIGPVADGLVLDHKCRVRCCANPQHIEPVTRRENARRGRFGVLTTHCPKGHPYDEKNTYRYTRSDGRSHRCCRACNRDINARRVRL